jgi:ribonuclease G
MEISPLGLVEMTRQNVTDGVREILTKRCPTCDGEGVVESEETVAIDVLRRLRDLVEERPKSEAFLIRVNPKVAAKLLETGSGLAELEAASGKHFHFEGGDALPLDTYDVAAEGSREEIEERALPFRVGEEVLLTIEEPHMYNVDDAVARVDAYIVSVTGGGPHVGERRMVRIDTVGRSAATGVLLDEDGNEAPQVQSGASAGRRRGRRGGRRRSGAQSGKQSGE